MSWSLRAVDPENRTPPSEISPRSVNEHQRAKSVDTLALEALKGAKTVKERRRSFSLEIQNEMQSTLAGVLAKSPRLRYSPRQETRSVCLEQLRALSPLPPTAHLAYAPPPIFQERSVSVTETVDLSSLTDLSTPTERRSPSATPPRSTSSQGDEESCAVHSELEDSVDVPIRSVSATPTQIFFETHRTPIESFSEPEEIEDVDRFVLEQSDALFLAELNKCYEKYIPDDYETLDPFDDEKEIMHPFSFESEKFVGVDSASTVKLGQCAVTDRLLETICHLHKMLVEVVLFHCLEIRNPHFLRNCSELRKLSLSWCRSLSPKWLAEISEGTWPHLETLELANTLTTGEMLKRLPPLQMKKLDLSHCWWIDSSAIEDLTKHPRLAWVRIEGVNVSQEAIQKLIKHGIQVNGNPQNCLSIVSEPKMVTDNEEVPGDVALFFLKRFMAEVYQIYSWNTPSCLHRYKKEIKKFYELEFGMRDLVVPRFSNQLEKWWAECDWKLQLHDRPNLSKIMDVLVPMIPNEGYSKVPGASRDCFRDLWEIISNPRWLNKITELNFSKQGLTEIPPSFWRLIFCSVKKLNFSDNKIKKLPKEVDELISAEERLDDHTICSVLIKRTHHFLSRYPLLEHLDFSGNEIRSLQGIFSKGLLLAGSLKTIDLSNNSIEDINSLDDLESASSVKFKWDSSPAKGAGDEEEKKED